MTDSFYSAFEQHEAPAKPEPVETLHANRKDLGKPYASPLTERAENAPAESEASSNAEVSWWRYFTRQIDNNVIAHKVNAKFNRAALTDYAKEKAMYIKEYNKELAK